LKLLFEDDGVYTTADRIVITNGAQQAIKLVLQYLFNNNKGKLLVEVTTYKLVLDLADHLDIELEGIERRIDGFDYSKLELLLKLGEISAFYIMPRHHNPTGYCLSEKAKQKVAELCCKYNVLIIEDDYLADLGSRKGAMPIHYYNMSKNTVYIQSFSKSFMPGVRIGAAVLPKSIVDGVLSLKYVSDLNTSKILQGALDSFIKSGMYEKHIKK
jgi:DNA-binding transcriptional MocR family regulator